MEDVYRGGQACCESFPPLIAKVYRDMEKVFVVENAWPCRTLQVVACPSGQGCFAAGGGAAAIYPFFQEATKKKLNL